MTIIGTNIWNRGAVHNVSITRITKDEIHLYDEDRKTSMVEFPWDYFKDCWEIIS